MINLDSTLKSLEIILSGVITTAQLPFVVSYVDVLSSDQSVSTISENDGTSNSTTAVTMVAAPAAGHTRTVKEFTVHNSDTVNATVTIRLNNNGTFRNLNVITLSTGDNLQYCDGGFSVITGVSIFPITVGNGGTGATTLTNHGVLLGQGTSPVVATAVGATNTLLHGNTGADPSYSAVVEADLGLTDLTTADVSTTKHGFAPKLPNDSTKFLNGVGAYAVPAGGAPTGATTTSTGTQNDFAPASITFVAGQITSLRCNNASLLTLNGIAGGVDGAFLEILSIGAGQVDLANQNASSTAANRIINPVTASISLSAGVGSCKLEYDGTTARWRVVQHLQGAFITPTFSAGDYVGTGNTWTVASGDVNTNAYMLTGRMITWIVYLSATTISGTGNHVSVTVPGGFTFAKTADGFLRGTDNGTGFFGFAEVTANGTKADLYRSDLANYTASTDNSQFQFQTSVEVK